MNFEEGMKQLVRLSQERGHVTYNDINEAFPDNEVSLDQLDEAYVQLTALGIQILDQGEHHSRN